MADFNITVSNQLNVFSESPSSKWGDMTWGVDFWGDSSKDLNTIIEKYLTNSVSLDNTLTPTAQFNLTVSDSLTVTSETTYESLQDADGYYYQFIKPTSDADQRQLTTWTEATPDTETWTSASVATDNWSET